MIELGFARVRESYHDLHVFENLHFTMTSPEKRRLIVAITGASGSIYGIETLRAVQAIENVETHLIVSAAGHLTLSQETGLSKSELQSLADVFHSNKDIGASIASGTFMVDAMIVAPCSMNSLSSIAVGRSDCLLTRAADVILKERRRLVLLARETPLSLGHIRNMQTVTEMGAVVFPPVPAFYASPRNIEDMIKQTIGHALNLCGVVTGNMPEWQGIRS